MAAVADAGIMLHPTGIGNRIYAEITPFGGPGRISPGSGSVPQTHKMQRFAGNPCGIPDVESVVGTWWVAQTKPQQEKNLAADLGAAGVDFFLPLVLRNSHKRGKREAVEVPLFPLYVFFAGGPYVRHAAVTTHRTTSILAVVDQAKFVRQLRGVQIAIGENPKLGLWPKTPTGSRARVTRGPFLGQEGIVEAIRENAANVRLILRLDVLGASTAVEMPAEYVEPV